MDPEDVRQLGMEKLQAYPEISICFAAVMGLLNCFFGYKLFKFLLALTGLVVGGIMGAAVAQELSDGQTGIVIAAGVGGGIVGAAAFYILHVACVFLIGASVGAGATMGGFAAAGQPPHYVAISVGATIGGIIALLLRRPVIIVSTAIGGAWSIAYAALFLLDHGLTAEQTTAVVQDPQGSQQMLVDLAKTTPYLIAFGCALVLAIAGILVQWGSTRPKPEGAEEKAEEE